MKNKIDQKIIVLEFFLALILDWGLRESETTDTKIDFSYKKILRMPYILCSASRDRDIMYDMFDTFIAYLYIGIIDSEIHKVLDHPDHAFEYLLYSKKTGELSVRPEYTELSPSKYFFKKYKYLEKYLVDVKTTVQHFEKCQWYIYEYSDQNLSNYQTQSSAWLTFVSIKKFEGRSIIPSDHLLRERAFFAYNIEKRILGL